MDDRAAISAWRLWMRATHAACGGVVPVDDAAPVGGLVPFAETDEGAWIARSPGGVVWVADVPRVIAEDVVGALALFVACGVVPFEDVAFRSAAPGPEEGAVAWLVGTCGVPPVPDVPAAIAAAARRPNPLSRGT